MTRPVRSAIVGTGAIAGAHAQAIRELAPWIELAAVVDLDADRARAFADAHGGARVYPDAAALFAAEDLDLVHVCTPPQTHVPLAVQALRAGVPALIEKPTAPNLAAMDELLAVSRETGVPALTVFQHRYGAAGRRLARLAREGALGRPLVATCDTLWFRAADYFDLPWRGTWEVEGGGPTMGHGIHQFDLMLAVLGPWTKLTAFAGRLAQPTDTEDVSMAVVEFDSGALASVVNSIVSPRETSRLRFDFEYASVEVEHLYGYTEADWRFTPAPGREDLAERWRPEASDTAVDHASSHRDQLAAILDAFETGETPGVDAGEARRTLEFAAAVYASAFRGAPVRAGELGADDPFAQTMGGGAAPWPRVRVAEGVG